MGMMMEPEREHAEEQVAEEDAEEQAAEENAEAFSPEQLADGVLRTAVEAPQQLNTALLGEDLGTDTVQFGRQYVYFANHELTFPSLGGRDASASPMPFDLTRIISPTDDAEPYPIEVVREYHSRAAEAARALARRSRFEYEEQSPDAAFRSFKDRLVGFLAVRFGKKPDLEAGPPFGLDFLVYAPRQGLRVFFTPAYWYSPRFFGSPTSPVQGSLVPGTYLFGADGADMKLQFDPTEYDVPGMTHADLKV